MKIRRTECSKEEFDKHANMLETYWLENDYTDIYKFCMDNKIVALIKMEIHEKDFNIDIFNFEVFNKGQGIGTVAIKMIINEYPLYKISLNANDKESEIFWKKCGFNRIEVYTPEILMEYDNLSIKNPSNAR